MRGGNLKQSLASGTSRIAEVTLSALLMASTSYADLDVLGTLEACLLYTSPSPRD